MCNGLNHYRHCKCGFGNDGFLSFDSSYMSHEVKGLAENFFNTRAGKLTIPNFLCKCGKRVFFFQDSNGGKVLFESLGAPWEKHFCLGWQYQKRIQKLDINPKKWRQFGHFSLTPSAVDGVSSIQGVVNDLLITVSLELDANHLLIVRDIYLDSKATEEKLTVNEALIIYEDGSYGFEQLQILNVEPLVLRDVGLKKIFKKQDRFDLFN
jgi:hypothetical protein